MKKKSKINIAFNNSLNLIFYNNTTYIITFAIFFYDENYPPALIAPFNLFIFLLFFSL